MGTGSDSCAVYIECQENSREEARKAADEVASDLDNEWFKPSETGLKIQGS